MTTTRPVVSALFGLLLVILANPSPAAAVEWHEFSIGIERAAGYPGTTTDTFTAFRMYRQDKAVTGLTSCSPPYVPFQNHPVFQTMWFWMNGGGFIELGTGHQCNDNYRYWFWGYKNPGDMWTAIGWENGVTNGNSHWFQVKRITGPDGPWYSYIIDSTTKARIYWNQKGNEQSALLESYTSTASIQYTMTDLSFQRNENVTWIDWTSNKTAYNKAVYPDMCGTWRSDTAWRAGEPDGSCN